MPGRPSQNRFQVGRETDMFSLGFYLSNSKHPKGQKMSVGEEGRGEFFCVGRWVELESLEVKMILI